MRDINGLLGASVKIIPLVILALAAPSLANAASEKAPDCGGSEGYAASTAFAMLKNEGLLNNEDIDFTKTDVRLIAAEKVGFDSKYRQSIYRLTYDVIYHKTSGDKVEAIIVHDATSEECSMTSADIFVVSKHMSTGDSAPLTSKPHR